MISDNPINTQIKDRLVFSWLCVVIALILAIITIGGATRLTNSGLSIAHWSPIHGVIPPLSISDWQEEFELYKKLPQYQLKNLGMSLEEFKFIFWWEWGHRVVARVLGLVYLIPLLIFWKQKRFNSKDAKNLFAIVLLIGFQGFLGWWMVTSGFEGDRVAVAAYRLAIHLGMAFTLLFILVNFAYNKYTGESIKSPFKSAWTYLIILFFIQVILGAFVAGTHSGFAHNDWPKIDGNWLPNNYFFYQPFLRNLVENTQAIQFNHRIFAYLVFLFTIHCVVKTYKTNDNLAKYFALLSLILCFMQIVLGVLTLKIFGIYTPPMMAGVLIGVLHQCFAAILFIIVIITWRLSLRNK